jgi:Uncharacterized protein conserved in bacteria (DUF2188)
MCKHIGLEEKLRKSRYIVLNHDGAWEIKNARGRVTATYPSKAQALCAAIELAEQEGVRGQSPEVLVRHEDNRFITEWVYGRDLHPDEAARPAGGKQPGRSGA